MKENKQKDEKVMWMLVFWDAVAFIQYLQKGFISLALGTLLGKEENETKYKQQSKEVFRQFSFLKTSATWKWIISGLVDILIKDENLMKIMNNKFGSSLNGLAYYEIMPQENW
jgi:hypothetical protein